MTDESRLRQVIDAAPILDSIPFSIVATDAHGRIISANAAAERLLGYDAAELVGSSLGKIDAEDRTSTHGWDQVLATAAGADREWIYRRKDGVQVPVCETITPLERASS